MPTNSLSFSDLGFRLEQALPSSDFAAPLSDSESGRNSAQVGWLAVAGPRAASAICIWPIGEAASVPAAEARKKSPITPRRSITAKLLRMPFLHDRYGALTSQPHYPIVIPMRRPLRAGQHRRSAQSPTAIVAESARVGSFSRLPAARGLMTTSSPSSSPRSIVATWSLVEPISTSRVSYSSPLFTSE